MPRFDWEHAPGFIKHLFQQKKYIDWITEKWLTNVIEMMGIFADALNTLETSKAWYSKASEKYVSDGEPEKKKVLDQALSNVTWQLKRMDFFESNKILASSALQSSDLELLRKLKSFIDYNAPRKPGKIARRLEEISSNLMLAVRQNALVVADKLLDLSVNIVESGDKIRGVEAEIDYLSGEVSELKLESEGHLARIKELQEGSSTIYQKIGSTSDSANRRLKSINDILSYTRKIRSEILDANTEISERRKSVRVSHKLVQISEEDIVNLLQNSQKKIELDEIERSKVLVALNTAKSEAERILFGVSTAGMARFWQKRRMVAGRSQLMTNIGISIVALLAIGLAISFAAVIFVPGQTFLGLRFASNVDWPKLVVIKVSIASPIIFLLWFLTRRADHLRRLEAEFSRREVVAFTLEPYKDFLFELTDGHDELKRDAIELFIKTIQSLYKDTLDGGREINKGEVDNKQQLVNELIMNSSATTKEAFDRIEQSIKLVNELKKVGVSID
ncbi:MAG: hypothetical protein JST12_02355 [Armatimonadetes bacterium]|nr:hypothetical protein [Armatimonadota bacterium]